MDLLAYLADENRYRELLLKSMQEVRRRMVIHSEDANDIASEAMERLLDYYARKPEKLFDLESMKEEKASNYIKKALRNHIINIIKKRQRQVFIAWEEIGDMPASQAPSMATTDLHSIRQELHFFIEEKFGRGKWAKKKEAIDIYIERISGNQRMRDLQARFPGKNIAVLNTEAHRIVKSYACWAQKNGRSLTKEIKEETL